MTINADRDRQLDKLINRHLDEIVTKGKEITDIRKRKYIITELEILLRIKRDCNKKLKKYKLLNRGEGL